MSNMKPSHERELSPLRITVDVYKWFLPSELEVLPSQCA